MRYEDATMSMCIDILMPGQKEWTIISHERAFEELKGMEAKSSRTAIQADDAMETEVEEHGSGSLLGSKPSSSQNLPPPMPSGTRQTGQAEETQERNGADSRPDWSADM